MASMSSAALSEILGVSSSTSGSGQTTTYDTPIPSTPINNAESATSTVHSGVRPVISDQLTTSGTSVADYFAAKMKAKKEQMMAARAPSDGLSSDADKLTQKGDQNTKTEKKRKKRSSVTKGKGGEHVDGLQDSLDMRPWISTDDGEGARKKRKKDDDLLKKKKKKKQKSEANLRAE